MSPADFDELLAPVGVYLARKVDIPVHSVSFLGYGRYCLSFTYLFYRIPGF